MPRAARYDRTGGPDVLVLADVPEADPTPGAVRVRVQAAGLNPFDGKQRRGLIPSAAPFPRRIGGDVAGTVTAVGDGALYTDGTPVRVGDAVFGRAAGAVAEEVVAAASTLAPRPAQLPVEIAGALWVAGLTAVSCLATVPVGAGDTLLVGAASGGVGLIAGQLAVAAGARVIGTAAPAHHDLLRSWGIEPVAYGAGLADRVTVLARPTAVFDCHGREALDAGAALGVPGERMVGIAASDALAELGAHEVERQARTPANLLILAAEIVAGRLHVPIARTFALDEVVAAFTALETSHAPGKIVVLP